MRSTTAGELATLAANTRQLAWRVKIANGSGTMIDLSSWVDHITIDQDADQPVSGATVSFVRASGATQSLSPLRTDSTLNRLDDGVTYAPQLDINRSITIELTTTPIGTAPVAGDYKRLFKGTIDVVDFEHSPVSVSCRDLGAAIVDRWVETPKPYGSGPGIAVETVMQSILDDNFGGGVISLYTPSSPSYVISPAYPQQVESIMDAMVALAQNPGFDVRYRWDDGTSAERFTLLNPPRSKTTPDYTFGPSGYFDVTKLSLDLTNIRNVIIVSYTDSGAQFNRATVTVSDAPSIAKYGRRVFIITEGDTSPINTSAEATTLANAALADLKEPKADQEVELPFFWPADLGDLYRFTANGVHYNSNQDLAVVGITHDLSAGQHRTRVKVRGSPIGQYSTWLARGGTIGGPAGGSRAPIPFIIPLNTEANDTAWNLQFYASYGTGGGGVNLTYTVIAKKTFGAETTLSSGNASAFPVSLAVSRDPKYDKDVRLTVTDMATGLSDVAHFSVPSYRPEIDANARITNQSYINQVQAGSRGSIQTSDPLTAADVGTTATVSIATHVNVYGFGSVSYNSGSVTGLLFSTKYYIYADDPTFAGGSVTYAATLDNYAVVGNTGRYYVGSITTPADGAGGTSGGGGGACVAEDMWLTPWVQAEDVVPGDVLDLWLGGEMTEQAPVQKVLPSVERVCVLLESQSGAKLTLSADTPVTLKSGQEIRSANLRPGDELPVLQDDGTVKWERVRAEPAGIQSVVPISLGGGTFAAGESRNGPKIFTHNFSKQI